MSAANNLSAHHLFIGTSGWSYDHWQGVLYPPNTPVKDRLRHAVRVFDTVEVNATYYHWPPDSTFDGWRRQVPPRFEMAVKAAGELTHRERLREPEEWMARIESAMRRLGDKAGPLLVQLPPRFAPDLGRLERFLRSVPEGRRVAMEFRHPGWHAEKVFDLLERHGAAYCVMSGARLPCILRATAPFAYIRFHGPSPTFMYGGSYSDDDLRRWADRIAAWSAEGRDVYAYFNNDGAGVAVRNALTLHAFLGLPAQLPPPPPSLW